MSAASRRQPPCEPYLTPLRGRNESNAAADWLCASSCAVWSEDRVVSRRPWALAGNPREPASACCRLRGASARQAGGGTVGQSHEREVSD